jgi:hypothetical protein
MAWSNSFCSKLQWFIDICRIMSPISVSAVRISGNCSIADLIWWLCSSNFFFRLCYTCQEEYYQFGLQYNAEEYLLNRIAQTGEPRRCQHQSPNRTKKKTSKKIKAKHRSLADPSPPNTLERAHHHPLQIATHRSSFSLSLLSNLKENQPTRPQPRLPGE